MSVRTEVYSVDDFFQMGLSKTDESWVIVSDNKSELQDKVNRVIDEMDSPSPMHSFILIPEGRTIFMTPKPDETLLRINMDDRWYSCSEIIEPTPVDLDLMGDSVLGEIDE